MNVPAELRKLLASLDAQLVVNGRDFDALERKREGLTEERRKLIRGIEGIRAELTKLEGD